MTSEREKAEAGIHDPKTCPGWYLTKRGGIEGCVDCGFNHDDDVVEERARAFFRAQPKRHHDEGDDDGEPECSGCPGYDVFEPIGCTRNTTRFWIEKNDTCGVFRTDDEAISAAIEACLQAGYIIVDGER